jgi:hypothetical protein
MTYETNARAESGVTVSYRTICWIEAPPLRTLSSVAATRTGFTPSSDARASVQAAQRSSAFAPRPLSVVVGHPRRRIVRHPKTIRPRCSTPSMSKNYVAPRGAASTDVAAPNEVS